MLINTSRVRHLVEYACRAREKRSVVDIGVLWSESQFETLSLSAVDYHQLLSDGILCETKEGGASIGQKHSLTALGNLSRSPERRVRMVCMFNGDGTREGGFSLGTI